MLYLTKKCASCYSHKTPEILLRLYGKFFSTADIANIQIALAYAIHLFCRLSRVVVRALIELQTFASVWRQRASFADELRVERGALQKL